MRMCGIRDFLLSLRVDLKRYVGGFDDDGFIHDLPDGGRDLSRVASQRADELVKRFGKGRV